MKLEQLENKWRGETVYVLGSGGSLNFLDPSFFDDKHCVAVNFVGREFGLRDFVTFTHYNDDAMAMALQFPANKVVVREWHVGHQVTAEAPNLVVAPSNNLPAPGASFDPYAHNDLSLLFGSSSIHGAMHLAAYMGAKDIVLVGADCGTLDGADRVTGYPAGDTPWALYETHLRLVKSWLKLNYNCNVYSLNPFVNFNLEGHIFEGVK